jgi:hypothetical protein
VVDDVEQFARRIAADDADEPTRQTDLHWLRVALAPAELGLRHPP